MEDSETGCAGSFPDQLGILHILYLLSPAFVEDSETGYAGSLPDQLGVLHILSLSGKEPGIRHTRVKWNVGTKYLNPIQPYSFSRQLYLSYQVRLCSIIQLGYVRVVFWFPCWGPVGLRAGILMPRFCSSIPQHLGPLVWAPRVARYHRPFEARSANSTRRESFQQLAACDSSPHTGWFAPLSVPPGSPIALTPVVEPLGGTKPREAQKPCCMRR